MVGSVALAILVFDKTGDPLATTALFVSSRFVPAFLALPSPARVDQLAAGPTLAAIYAVEATLVSWVSSSSPITFVDADPRHRRRGRGLVDRRAGVDLRASVAVMLEPAGLLREGNALFNLVFAATSTAAGPALAGLLIAWQDVAAALALDATSFALIAALLVSSKGSGRQRTEADAWASRFKAGFAWVRDQPYVLPPRQPSRPFAFVFACVVPIEADLREGYTRWQARASARAAEISARGAGIVVGSLVMRPLAAPSGARAHRPFRPSPSGARLRR